jgi:hypothetical protein
MPHPVYDYRILMTHCCFPTPLNSQVFLVPKLHSMCVYSALVTHRIGLPFPHAIRIRDQNHYEFENAIPREIHIQVAEVSC